MFSIRKCGLRERQRAGEIKSRPRGQEQRVCLRVGRSEAYHSRQAKAPRSSSLRYQYQRQRWEKKTRDLQWWRKSEPRAGVRARYVKIRLP